MNSCLKRPLVIKQIEQLSGTLKNLLWYKTKKNVYKETTLLPVGLVGDVGLAGPFMDANLKILIKIGIY